MTSLDGLNVRLATASDYKAVLDINRNVYDGFDYLPSLYFYFLHHPEVLLFVAELNGKIVSTIAQSCTNTCSLLLYLPSGSIMENHGVFLLDMQ